MPTQPKAMTITGWILTILLGLLLAFSATMKFIYPPEMAKDFVGKFGYADDLAFTVGVLEAVCVLLFVIPQTTVLGAVLLTGYLGGAVATHVRVHDPFISPAMIGVFVWLAVYLRDSRVRALLPFRRSLALRTDRVE